MSVARAQQTHSHLFTLRVWAEDVGNGRSEIRGVLKHILTGETHHFRDWHTLSQLLESFVLSSQTEISGEKS